VATRRTGWRSAASARIAAVATFGYQQADVYFASSVLTCQLHKDNCLVLDSRIVLFGTVRQLFSSFGPRTLLQFVCTGIVILVSRNNLSFHDVE
jgi:hypothetical protein